MAKKSAAVEVNMSKTIREILEANPEFGTKETTEAVLAKHPGVKINPNSFSVAFYNARIKLGISSSKRGRKVSLRKSLSPSGASPKVTFATLQSAAKFLSDVGGVAAALEAIKQVQAVQVK